MATNSGGVREQTTYPPIPCLTPRDTTERPVTVSQGSNRLVKVADWPRRWKERVLAGRWPKGRPIELWDGRIAARAADNLARFAGVAPERLVSLPE